MEYTKEMILKLAEDLERCADPKRSCVGCTFDKTCDRTDENGGAIFQAAATVIRWQNEKLEENTSSVTAEAATPSPQGEGFPDPMIEDTYLMPEHPLPLELQVKLYGACLEMGVDYELALAVVEQETRFRNLMGDDGESAGYMQVQEKWHKDRMALLGVDDLQDPEGNFRVGCHFLKECIDKYGLEKGLGYYNSGKAVVTDYSREVLGRLG